MDPLTGQQDFILKSPLTAMNLVKTNTEENRSGGTILKKMKAFSRFIRRENVTSGFNQFIILFKMMMLIIYRSKTVFWIQFIHHLMCGTMIGELMREILT